MKELLSVLAQYERLFFVAPREFGFGPHTPVVYTEDAFSSMRINDRIGQECIGLLSTHLPYQLVRFYKDSTQVIWLDPDMRKVAVDLVTRYQSLGFKMTTIFSDEDPKFLNDMELRSSINKAVIEVAQGEHIL